MLMPLDIQNKEFSRGVRGYKEEEVDRFLDIIMVDYENLLEESKTLKARIEELEGELAKKKQLEDSVKDTLDSTRSLMKEVSENAEKMGESVIKKAELDADIIIQRAKETAKRYNDEAARAKDRLDIFNERFKNLLGAELDRFTDALKDVERSIQE